MTESEFNNLRTLHAATTPGEWDYVSQGVIGLTSQSSEDAMDHPLVQAYRSEGDAAFIVAAHNEFPALLARLDEVTAERDRALSGHAEMLALNVKAEHTLREGIEEHKKLEAERDALAAVIEKAMRTAARENDVVLYRILSAAPSSVLAAHDAKVRAYTYGDAGWVASESYTGRSAVPENPYRTKEENR